jgi:PAS domain S-box-containing protein
MDLGQDVIATINLLPEPMLIAGVEGRILGANAAFAHQLGVPQQSLIGSDMRALAADAPGKISDYLRRCARSGQLLLGSITLRRSDGQALKYRAGGAVFRPSESLDADRTVLLRLVPEPESGVAFIALNEKIRELYAENVRRRLIEAALRKERETLQVTLASIGDAVIVTDADGSITFLNEVAESLVGRKLEYAQGRPLGDVFRIMNEHTHLSAEDPVRKALGTGTSVDLANHTVLMRPDGTTIPVDDSAAPIRLEGRVIGAVLIFRDISGRRRAEQESRDADRRKDEFLATLAHELRNPLAPIRNAMQIMSASRTDEDEKSAGVRAVIERQLKHMVRLIDDLMDVSRITQGRLELHQERVDLELIVKIAAETSQPLIEAKQHRLRINPPAEPIYVQADVTRLAQVFSNLLNNSAKYSPAGSDIYVTLQRENNSAIVDVADSGMGIPAAMIPRIFDMFVQISRPGLREGLGIGLTLVKRIVDLHGGTIVASSGGESRGSNFRVRLAAADLPVVDRPASPIVDRVPVSVGARILVADDNRDAADTLALILELDGHEVQKAYDGLEALKLAEEFRPQIALLDIGMPHMDGYQTARRIRDRPWGDSVLLVALTGWGQEQDRRQASEAGFDQHLVKPVDPQAIVSLVEQTRSRR